MENKKFHSLDGLRGLAALSVVLLHYVTGFAPFLIGYVATTRHTPFDRIIATSPLQLPVAGSFAVSIFFVLSGFVLSVSFFKHKTTAVLVSSAARRYFRLMLPALGSVLFAYGLLRAGTVHNHEAAMITESSNWLALLWGFPAHLGTALYEGLYGIFFTVINTSDSYNAVLWTMHFELFGSFLVFLSLALFGKLQKRWFFYGVLALAFLKTNYLAFVGGMVMSDLWFNYPHLIQRLKSSLLWPLLLAAIVLGCWPTATIYTSLYSAVHVPFFTPSELSVFAQTIGAILAMAAVLRLHLLARFFETRPLQYLGKVSFSLYLTHFIILGSLGCTLFIHLFPHLGYARSVFLTFALSMIPTFIIATLYARFVDVPSIALSKRIGDFLIGDQKLRLEWWTPKLMPRSPRLPILRLGTETSLAEESTPAN